MLNRKHQGESLSIFKIFHTVTIIIAVIVVVLITMIIMEEET